MATRDALIDRLAIDLIGPLVPNETIDAKPSDVYLTGILWPQNTAIPPEQDERLAVAGGEGDSNEESDEASQPAAAQMRRPSTAGISFACTSDGDVSWVKVDVACGRYEPHPEEQGKWVRIACAVPAIEIELIPGSHNISLPSVGIEGVRLNVRVLPFDAGLLVTLTLVNGSMPQRNREAIESATLFQTGLAISAIRGSRLITRPSRKAVIDADDRSNALLFRRSREYATGHTCSAQWDNGTEGREINAVRTAWIPQATTHAVSPEGSRHFAKLAASGALAAATLAHSPDGELIRHLGNLCDAYGAWLSDQYAALSSIPAVLLDTANAHLEEVARVLRRMRSGVERLASDHAMAESFRLANLAMETQRLWGGSSLVWRPFQLGFLLLSMESTLDPQHTDRGVMDLLWFPTGGGKTEAYLGLVAMVAFHRRLVGPRPEDGDGVACIMRYTLRLLTTQQFIRAAATICACEAIRRGTVDAGRKLPLGRTPFSLGLWVGGDATPNTRKDAFDNRGDAFKPQARQLTKCPCCNADLDYAQRRQTDPIVVECRTAECALSKAPIPVFSVDEDIYQQRPTMLLGTVDKFAQIVRNPASRALFGVGTPMQPQLILQDELHLIAGPLGTLTGLYEAAIDIILSDNGRPPKIVGSTATIRRAQEQVRALFDRDTCQFPPPGLDAEDSGFAVQDRKLVGRRYIGLTTAGRSAKFTLQAVSASLMNGALHALGEGERDPYWTLLAYFNSLRELGGALVLMQDDVSDTLALLATRMGRQVRHLSEIEELTSRRTQADIRDMLDRLAVRVDQPGAVDVVLATNMVSVGVDIPRLGLMLVNGQPKTMAEYIQATSRVGRGSVEGLVVALLNNAKPRDRSHYETFSTWHSMLYRFVEATSTTPFAARARDRALHAVLVALVRHLIPEMLEEPTWSEAAINRARVLIDLVVARAGRIDADESDVHDELHRRLEAWIRRAPEIYWKKNGSHASPLMQSAEEAAARRATGRVVGQAWPTPNSMRGVEPATPYRLVPGLRNNDVAQ
ncbi:helicase-related protein [Xanthomonas arboricola]|uniref:helicase-related protein n=1 Tax=Xanthomonas arboricola TaxID=56448 RepID=UPI001AF84BFD|nr:helicase-related protein [Xanthomonas arboricola]CAD7377155.1 DNA/RNA helicase [Xanthomonas arboricola]CAG2084848.1 DNA/RNA helicase [Xanthomonas arboricola pv. juglandis]